MDIIRIRGLELDCIVGLHPLERDREQRVHLDIELGMDLSKAGRTGRIAFTCDYSEIAEEVMAMLRFRRYHLIEMATEELAAMLLGLYPVLELADIQLDKPAALDGRARAASVQIKRTPAAFPRTVVETAFGSRETLLETRDAGLYRLRVDPGCELPGGYARGDASLEWLLSGTLVHEGTPLERRVPSTFEGASSAAVNTGSDPAFLYRCCCPSVLGGS